jgi:hypothetical protein
MLTPDTRPGFRMPPNAGQSCRTARFMLACEAVGKRG